MEAAVWCQYVQAITHACLRSEVGRHGSVRMDPHANAQVPRRWRADYRVRAANLRTIDIGSNGQMLPCCKTVRFAQRIRHCKAQADGVLGKRRAVNQLQRIKLEHGPLVRSSN